MPKNPTFITNFQALNVPLNAGSNIITAVIEDLTGVTNAVSITVTGLTNFDGSMNNIPVQLTGTPIAGFSPLTVMLNVVSNNVPGTFQQALYDFNGDGIVDFSTNNLDSVTVTYTNGEYFPTVTIQTTAGLFSSSGGWNHALNVCQLDSELYHFSNSRNKFHLREVASQSGDFRFHRVLI